jgi:hypothetical protein
MDIDCTSILNVALYLTSSSKSSNEHTKDYTNSMSNTKAQLLAKTYTYT